MLSLLCRGDCGGEFGLVGIPLSVEVIVGMLALSLVLLVRGDCCGVVALSLIPLV